MFEMGLWIKEVDETTPFTVRLCLFCFVLFMIVCVTESPRLYNKPYNFLVRKMSIVRNVVRSSFGLRLSDPIAGLSSLRFINERRKCFSTETEHQPSFASPPSPEGPPVDGFFRSPETGPVYGRLLGSSRHTLKTDILNLLQGCNLTQDDVKFSYVRGTLAPAGTYVQFPSRFSFSNAIRLIARRAKLYRLERVDRSQWDLLAPYEGKAVVLHGVPWNALMDDVERFLSGCDYYPSSIQFFTRPGIPAPARMAMVRFASQTQAMNAFITKNKGFCLNNQITVQVLQ